MAKKHLDTVREKVLDGFESDETMNYEAPKQKKDEAIKLKNLHRLKAKKKAIKTLNKKNKETVIEISDDDKTLDIKIIKSVPALGKQAVHPVQKHKNRLARKRRAGLETYRKKAK